MTGTNRSSGSSASSRRPLGRIFPRGPQGSRRLGGGGLTQPQLSPHNNYDSGLVITCAHLAPIGNPHRNYSRMRAVWRPASPIALETALKVSCRSHNLTKSWLRRILILSWSFHLTFEALYDNTLAKSNLGSLDPFTRLSINGMREQLVHDLEWDLLAKGCSGDYGFHVHIESIVMASSAKNWACVRGYPWGS